MEKADVVAHVNDANNNESSADWWKTTAVTLAAILVSVGGSWLAFGRDSVTSAQVTDIVNRTSPFALERSGISQHLVTIDLEVASLQQDFHRHSEDDARQRARFATIVEQIREIQRGR